MNSTTLELVVKNDAGLEKKEVDKLLQMIQDGRAMPLSPKDQEGPMLLFVTGEDLDNVALTTNYPKEIIYLTALQYGWYEKKKTLDAENMSTDDIKHKLARQLLVASYLQITRDLGAVIAGNKKASEVPMIPKNMLQMEKLFAMIGIQPDESGGSVTNNNIFVSGQQPSQQAIEATDDKTIDVSPDADDKAAMMEDL